MSLVLQHRTEGLCRSRNPGKPAESRSHGNGPGCCGCAERRSSRLPISVRPPHRGVCRGVGHRRGFPPTGFDTRAGHAAPVFLRIYSSRCSEDVRKGGRPAVICGPRNDPTRMTLARPGGSYKNTTLSVRGDSGPRCVLGMLRMIQSPVERDEGIDAFVAIIDPVSVTHAHTKRLGEVEEVQVEDGLRTGGAVQLVADLSVIVEQISRDALDV